MNLKEKEMSSKFDVKNLNLYYGEYHALKNVNMEIPEKQITAFIGPSGCGKTTILRMIAGFETPDDGDVLFDGESVSKVPVNKSISSIPTRTEMLPSGDRLPAMAMGMGDGMLPMVAAEKRKPAKNASPASTRTGEKMDC